MLLAFSLPVFAASAPATLRLTTRAEKHVRERHFPGGSQTRGKSVFFASVDLYGLLSLAAKAAPRRQGNGRDKRVVDAGKPVGTDGRSRRVLKTYVVISEPDGLVITMYPGG